jgi:hypothetical protein
MVVFIGIFFFLATIYFLLQMLVTFLLQKPKLLMKYFILKFSYIIKILSNNIHNITDEDQTLIKYTYKYAPTSTHIHICIYTHTYACMHIHIHIYNAYISTFQHIPLLFWSSCTWLILVIYSLSNKEYMFTCLVCCSDT